MFKKLFSICLAVFIAASFASPEALAAGEPEIHAKGAIIGEMKTGETVYELNADQRLYPASTTKVMTAILALENGNPDDIVTVSAEAVDSLEDSGSSVLLKEGEQMVFKDMVTYLLVASGNDAANALAQYVSGSIPDFVALMNAKAQELGCTNTHFANPHGLHDENHYTTARDLLKIAEYAMQNETFASIVQIGQTVLPATNMRGEHKISTTNHLISRWRNKDYFYDGAIGIKTGSTTPAGLCLISGVKSGDLTYITVVLGAEKGEDGNLGSFSETIKLLDYAKTGFALQPIADSTDPVAEAPVALGKDADSVVLKPENGAMALLPVDFNSSLVEKKCSINENIKAPVEEGQVLGKVTYSYEGKDYAEINLVAADSVRRSLWLFIADTIVSIFSSTVFKIVVGVLVAAFIIIIIAGSVKRKRNRRRSYRRSSYQGRRRR